MSELKVDKVSPRSGTYLAVGTLSYKNILINGDMSIAQRSTSVASITGSGYYTVDRMNLALISLGTWTQSQSTDVPTGQGFATSLKMDCTTADAAPSASDQVIIQQRIEGQNLQYLKKGTANAESLTLSFWVKSNKTGTYVVNILDNDNSRQISNSYTINASNTWEKKTLTFAGDTTGVFGNDNNLSIELNFWLGAGSTYTSGTLQTSWTSTANADLAVGQVNLADNTANEFYITGVQLEAGTTASDFEFLPVDVNLNRCQRYYYNVGTGGNNTTIFRAYVDGGGSDIWQPHPYLMRAAPTITTEGTWETEASTSQPIGRFQTTQGFSFRFTRSGGFGDAYVYANSTDDRLTIDAEL
jgi:hypothetical protein